MEIENHSINACLVNQTSSFDLLENTYLLLIISPFWLMVAVVVSPWILHRYKKNIERFMKTQGDDVVKTSLLNTVDVTPQWTAGVHRDIPVNLLDSVRSKTTQSRRVILYLAIAFLLALSIPVTLSDRPSGWAEFGENLGGALFFCAALLSPLITIIYHSHKHATRLLLIVFIALLAILLYSSITSSVSDFSDEILGALFVALYAAIAYFGLCGQQLRNIVPYITIVLALAAIGALFSIFSTYLIGCSLNIDDENGYFMLSALFVLLLAVIGLPLLGIRTVAKLYINKQLSDQQLLVCCWFIVAALSMLILMQLPEDDTTELTPSAWLVIPTLLVALYLYLEYSASEPLLQDPPRLLLLRVFNKAGQAQQLIGRVASTWRYVGPIHMIAGPDLAKASAEPDEIYLYLTRRLKRLFIKNMTDCNNALDNLDNRPDPDGRYRVNEFFCFDNIWESVARKLIHRSDYLLLDLREFSITRMGTAKEIVFLSQSQAFSRTLILVESQEKAKEMRDSIHLLTGVTVSADQIQSMDDSDHREIVDRLLKLRDMDLQSSYQTNELKQETTQGEQADLQQQTFQYYKQIVEAHLTKKHTFSYLVMFLGFAGMLIGVYSQLVAPLYLKIRGVAWGRCIKTALLIWLFSFSSQVINYLLIVPRLESESLDAMVMPLLSVLALIILFIVAWIPVSARANRWIAESKEPVKSALRFVQTYNDTH